MSEIGNIFHTMRGSGINEVLGQIIDRNITVHILSDNTATGHIQYAIHGAMTLCSQKKSRTSEQHVNDLNKLV